MSGLRVNPLRSCDEIGRGGATFRRRKRAGLRRVRRLLTALALLVGAVVPATVAGPAHAGAATAGGATPRAQRTPWGTAVPISVAGPAWFDARVYRRVLAAGAHGVPLASVRAGKKSGSKRAAAATAGSCLGSSGAGGSGAVPATPNGVERPPVGIGPGTWLISLFCTNVGSQPVPDGFAWCTANFVFTSGGSFGLGTAGHCAAKDALGDPVTAVVQPPPESPAM